MYIYLLEQDINDDYDTYDSFVCVAENVEEARKIHPSEYVTHIKDKKWMGTYIDGGEYEMYCSGWVKYEDIGKIKVTYLGKAEPNLEKGVICSSFNAG